MPRRNTPAKPTVVRRVIKTVTEEIIEEIHPAPPQSSTTRRTSTPTKTTPKKAVKRDPSSTSNTAHGTKRTTPTVKKIIVKKAAVNESAVNKSAVKKTPVKKTPVKKTPVKRAPAKQTPAKQTPAKQTPAKQTPAKKTPAKKTPAKKTPAKKTPAKKTPAKKTPAKKTPAKKTPVRKPPATTPQEPNKFTKTTSTPRTLEPSVTRTPATPKQSARQFAQRKAPPVKRTLQSAIAKPHPAAKPRKATNKSISFNNKSNPSPTVARAAATPATLYDAPLPPPVEPYSDSSSDEHLNYPPSNSRSVYGGVRKIKQTARKSSGTMLPPATLNVRKSSGASCSKVTMKPEAEIGVKLENIIAPPSHLRSVHSTVRKVKQTARKSSAAKSLSTTTATGRATAVNQRTGRASTSKAASGAQTQGVWTVTHETGFYPDGFHSYIAPTTRGIGTYTTRAAAIKRGKQVIGEDVGYSWQEVREAGDLEVISDTQQKWKITWSPPDSQYSHVTACFIPGGAGVWAVDVETGFIPDGFHLYMEPTKRRIGVYQTRQAAVEEGKKRMGEGCGWDWEEVAQDGDFEIRQDCAERWEGFWGPPDSEYTLVVAKKIGLPTGGMSEDNIQQDRGDEDDEDEEGCSSQWYGKQTARKSISRWSGAL